MIGYYNRKMGYYDDVLCLKVPAIQGKFTTIQFNIFKVYY